MEYSIKQVSEKMKLTIPTIRYYEKEGLLPPVNRKDSGTRIFRDNDLEWLGLICCLRNTGMPVKNIKQFVKWCLEGDSTIDNRIEILLEHKESVNEQIKVLQHYQEAINWKINHYTELRAEILEKSKSK